MELSFRGSAERPIALSHHLPGVVDALGLLVVKPGRPSRALIILGRILGGYWEGLSSPTLGYERGTHKLFGLTLL
jgi:hypothetical protein